MEAVKLTFQSLRSRTPLEDYIAILRLTLTKFQEDLAAGDKIIDEWNDINLAEIDDVNAWGARYTTWQMRALEGKELKRQLALARPKERDLTKLHNGLIILMNNRVLNRTANCAAPAAE